uniref:Uncharacterized protein n=1 Tax=Spongospora subterranea TaxID=70186 RepID=A0A0H5QYS1_9EUKA|eukprot:CRZ06857.1 hypothetical protein [Spongospora subterranea]
MSIPYWRIFLYLIHRHSETQLREFLWVSIPTLFSDIEFVAKKFSFFRRFRNLFQVEASCLNCQVLSWMKTVALARKFQDWIKEATFVAPDQDPFNTVCIETATSIVPEALINNRLEHQFMSEINSRTLMENLAGTACLTNDIMNGWLQAFPSVNFVVGFRSIAIDEKLHTLHLSGRLYLIPLNVRRLSIDIQHLNTVIWLDNSHWVGCAIVGRQVIVYDPLGPEINSARIAQIFDRNLRPFLTNLNNGTVEVLCTKQRDT